MTLSTFTTDSLGFTDRHVAAIEIQHKYDVVEDFLHASLHYKCNKDDIKRMNVEKIQAHIWHNNQLEEILLELQKKTDKYLKDIKSQRKMLDKQEVIAVRNMKEQEEVAMLYAKIQANPPPAYSESERRDDYKRSS